MSHPLCYTIYMKMKNDGSNKTTEPSLETQRDEVAHRTVSRSWDRQVDMNGDVYVRENEDYLDRD